MAAAFVTFRRYSDEYSHWGFIGVSGVTGVNGGHRGTGCHLGHWRSLRSQGVIVGH